MVRGETVSYYRFERTAQKIQDLLKWGVADSESGLIRLLVDQKHAELQQIVKMSKGSKEPRWLGQALNEGNGTYKP